MPRQKQLRGIIPPLVTAVTDDASEIDVKRMKALTARLKGSGVHGLFACSSTGEAPLLTREQRITVIDAVAEENGGALPLLAGVGAPATSAAVSYAKDAEAHGATHIVVLPLHFFRVSEDELERYFATVADSVSIPTMLYNYPKLTGGVNIAPALATELTRKHNIVGIKDSSGDLTQALHYIQATGPHFSVFSGVESLLLSLLQHGGSGVIPGSANAAPDVLIRLFDYYENGEFDCALDLQRDVVEQSPFWHLGTYPAAVKAACEIAGTPVGPPIPPGSPLGEETLKMLRKGLEALPSSLIQ
jgi:4-hydroxy-tetrahydrodipicolinate synthase